MAESLGAGFVLDAARLALGLTLARMVAVGVREAPQVAATIRQSIESARERNDRPLAVKMLHSAALLIGPMIPTPLTYSDSSIADRQAPSSRSPRPMTSSHNAAPSSKRGPPSSHSTTRPRSR
jgi:hypothetical protein